MKTFKKIVCLLLILLSLFGCKQNKDLDGPYVVERVVDGDTFITSINNQRIRVRALCIDTPESVAPKETGKTNTNEGKISSDRAKQLLEGKNVYLEYDIEQYDQYDRLLAYVYLDDKKTMFEEVMISEGLAKVVKYEPNVKYVEHFYELQDQARANKVGHYSSGFYK